MLLDLAVALKELDGSGARYDRISDIGMLSDFVLQLADERLEK